MVCIFVGAWTGAPVNAFIGAIGAIVTSTTGAGNVNGESVGDEVIGMSTIGASAGEAVIDGGTTGCTAIGVDLTGGLETGAALDSVGATGTELAGAIDIGIPVFGDIDGTGAVETILLTGGGVGDAELGTGKAVVF